MNSTDETVLARFAGGDMSTAEEADFLARCEIQPDLWRATALALVEHRQWASALREFAGDRNDAPSHPARRTTGGFRTRWPTMLAAAASLLAVMLGGWSVAYWAGQHQRIGVQQVRDLPEGTAETADPAIVVYYQAPSGQVYPSAIQAQLPPMPSPEAIAERLAAMNSRPVFPSEARSLLLREAGVEVDEEAILYVLDDGSGERWALPARNFHLRYVNH